jgi:ribosome biogenesis GTPase
MLNKQVMAANVDLAFIVQPLDNDFSPSRLERYLFQLTTQNIETIIVLNKTDVADDAPKKQSELDRLKTKTILISALCDDDLSSITDYIEPGKTIVVMGSSGAGKSTLINRLLGEQIQATQPIRESDSCGRHTTVHRELFVIPGGGLIIDTPGIRELQLWGDVSDLNLSFPEIATAIESCFYPNCSHITEDSCAIKAGLADGNIDPKRYSAYQNLRQELQALIDRRGFIENRRSQQSRESFKRRRNRKLDSDRSKDDSF